MGYLQQKIETEIPALRRYARALVRDAMGADDLVQDCLTRALAKLHLWSEGTDLRAPLRGGASDEEMLQLIRAVWERRSDRYSELRDKLRARGVQHVEMNYVGG